MDVVNQAMTQLLPTYDVTIGHNMGNTKTAEAVKSDVFPEFNICIQVNNRTLKT
jgi:hypothetical protein